MLLDVFESFSVLVLLKYSSLYGVGSVTALSKSSMNWRKNNINNQAQHIQLHLGSLNNAEMSWNRA